MVRRLSPSLHRCDGGPKLPQSRPGADWSKGSEHQEPSFCEVVEVVEGPPATSRHKVLDARRALHHSTLGSRWRQLSTSSSRCCARDIDRPQVSMGADRFQRTGPSAESSCSRGP
ncbi:hypothetical protein GOBAR_AA32101 [Gossypium barbadense]|uniref:Uncharacterized protein n=1 Tax=Gossypium barbadense TaxID=3634 RepID=A0A2P5WBY2_GOSBA|nr:hypothetical protein GOBAR_AA32101 [Gossypium barbadense]